MTTTGTPAIGLIGLTPISGQVGKLIEIGQWLNGDGFREWEHAFVSIGNGLIVEAEPGGARVAHATEYSVVHWCTGIYSLAAPAQLPLIEDAAKSFVSVPYSFLDYFALAQHRLHVPGVNLKNFIASGDHMICSQLVDAAYAKAGVHIFTDGRWPGYVTPADLYNRDMELVK